MTLVLSFLGLSSEIPRCNHYYADTGLYCGAAPAPRCTRTGTLTPRGGALLSSAAASAEAGAQPDRHSALLVCVGNGSDLCGCGQLSPLCLPSRQLQQRCSAAALEEDRGGEGPPAAHGLYADPVPVRLHVSFCCSSQRHLRALRLLL